MDEWSALCTDIHSKYADRNRFSRRQLIDLNDKMYCLIVHYECTFRHPTDSQWSDVSAKVHGERAVMNKFAIRALAKLCGNMYGLITSYETTLEVNVSEVVPSAADDQGGVLSHNLLVVRQHQLRQCNLDKRQVKVMLIISSETEIVTVNIIVISSSPLHACIDTSSTTSSSDYLHDSYDDGDDWSDDSDVSSSNDDSKGANDSENDPEHSDDHDSAHDSEDDPSSSEYADSDSD
jgi:hypothetical protein